MTITTTKKFSIKWCWDNVRSSYVHFKYFFSLFIFVFSVPPVWISIYCMYRTTELLRCLTITGVIFWIWAHFILLIRRTEFVACANVLHVIQQRFILTSNSTSTESTFNVFVHHFTYSQITIFFLSIFLHVSLFASFSLITFECVCERAMRKIIIV